MAGGRNILCGRNRRALTWIACFLFCYQCLAEPLADENFTVETDASLQDFLDRHSMNFCSEWGGAVLDPRTDLVTLSACVAQEATDSRLEKRWLPPHPAPPTL